MKRMLALLTMALTSAPVAADDAQLGPHGRIYRAAPPMNDTITRRILPQVGSLLDKLLVERRGMTLDGIPVFEAHDKFLPGKIAVGLSYLLLDTPRADPRFRRYLEGYRTIAAMTVDDPNESWGIYYYMSALHQLKNAGLLERAVAPETLARLRTKLDWRRFVRANGTLIDLPNNYYGVAFSVARLRNLLGWEDATAGDALLKRMIDHYRRYSGRYGFADETDGQGRFDRYSVLLIGEIAQRFIETGSAPPEQVKDWLRGSARLLLQRANLTGEGFEYGRSIGAYGDTSLLEVLAAAAKLDVLTPEERDMAYALSSRITARYADFWLDPRTGSVNLWDGGRRTDAYRGKNRILGENLSLARQYIYTDAEWNEMGYRGRQPADGAYPRWLGTLPRATLTWFARGAYDRALLTIRDGSHVIGLPLINGAEGQHMHNPYFPVPFSAGMLQGSADSAFPQLTPRFTLANGDVLMPLAWFRNIKMRRQGDRTSLTYRIDAMDRMGGRDAVEDGRLRVETRYEFLPGRITRTDRYSVTQPLDLADIRLEFATFSSDPKPVGHGFAFSEGEVSRFVPNGFGCSAEPAAAPQYGSPTGPFKTVLGCTSPARRVTPGAPLILGWTLTYR